MLNLALSAASVIIGLAVLLNIYRLIKGPAPEDRILAIDTLTINTIALVLLFGIANRSSAWFETALLLAMLGFVSTVLLGKFLGDNNKEAP
ncbi:K+/H+ antiporter subunit F [Polymorphobacter glacialis]|uniref:K+/H+ antiporter subunit F n=1 Tax=Sandarakinorhabdus glacialis TaxID=1614636 RepID=A0A916ZJ55_9SPHN|nr:K+/H+ antiporter subunit F [Polymorphobacter glacialis]GGE00483.1 K+/H+ antiporter subunit F [Polymorphobacter glacialis]